MWPTIVLKAFAVVLLAAAPKSGGKITLEIPIAHIAPTLGPVTVVSIYATDLAVAEGTDKLTSQRSMGTIAVFLRFDLFGGDTPKGRVLAPLEKSSQEQSCFHP